MSLLSSLLVLATFFSASFAFIPLSTVQRVTSFNIAPSRFVVELDNINTLIGKRSSNVHADFYAALAKRAGPGGFTVNQEYNSPAIFVGASITLATPDALVGLANIPGVKAIRPVAHIPSPKPINRVIPTGPNDPAVPADTESTHIMTGVDKVHAQGILGSGIKIGILDTGIDYTNPVLGGGFGPGYKVAGGYDFVGDAFNGSNTPMPDNNPLDQCNGHGTHVAGIIGANPGNEFNISGVAYEATLYAYRIFGCTGPVPDDIIIQALLQANSDGMDIITLSLGASDGWTEATSSVVASRLADSGKVLTIAAGNDGAFGSWYTSHPGNGISVISVASVDNTLVPIQNATTSDPTHPTIPYFSLVPLPINGSLPIYATSNDTTLTNDACNPLPDTTPDLSKFLVIVRRGTCSFVTKLQNIAAKGAKASLIYNNGVGLGSIVTGNFTDAALISLADGQFLVNQFAAGIPITVSFPQTGRSYQLPSSTGGLISAFSSYGPTNDFFFKPALAAPGGNILSTFPVPLGKFSIESGTSMATPFIAGSAALLLQARGKSISLDARTRFETTAHSVPSNHTDGEPLQTLTQQGAGLVNVYNALNFKTVVTPGELILNDTTHFVGTHTITIQNTGAKWQKYSISHVPAGTAQSLTPGTIFHADGPVPLTTDYAEAIIVPSTLVLPGHGTGTVLVQFLPPRNVIDPSTFPVYSGFIQVQSHSSSETLHVAYQGLAAAARDFKIIDDTDNTFGFPLPAVLDSRGDPQANATNYTFVNGDFPTLLFRLASGTPKFTVDLVAPGMDIKKGGFSSPSGTYGHVPTIGLLAEFDYQPRNSDAPDTASNGFSTFAFSIPRFDNQTLIPRGQYRILVRALKITGDPSNEGDYETYLSPIIGVDI